MIYIIVQVVCDIQVVCDNKFLMQEIRFLHFVYPVSWIITISVKVNNFVYVPALNIHIFNPIVYHWIIVTFRSPKLSLEIVITFIYLKLIAMGLQWIRITFNKESFAVFKIWTNKRKSFPTFENLFMFFAFWKVIFRTLSSFNPFRMVPIFIVIPPINLFLSKVNIKVLTDCFIKKDRSIICNLLSQYMVRQHTRFVQINTFVIFYVIRSSVSWNVIVVSENHI